MNYPIPARSARALQAHRDKSPQNPGLIFERFAPDWSRQGPSDNDLKRQGLEAVRRAAQRADADLLKNWNLRWEKGVAACQAEPFALATEWRFIAGLGRKGPLEVGFTFNRYGFPILPGSSVKGIARAYASQVEKKDEGNPDFLAIFGRAPAEGEDDPSLAQAGGAVFFDAIPSRLPVIDLDIMNPHYPRYYQADEAPTNWQNPVPVYFLAVAPDTEFRFAVGWRTPLDADSRRLRDLARTWLMGGLTTLGAGAKTSAGYGFFSDGSVVMPSARVATATDAAPQPPAAPEAPTETRRGVIADIRPDQRRGVVRDLETGQEYRFTTDVIQEKGFTPPRRAEVIFELRGGKVVGIRRKER